MALMALQPRVANPGHMLILLQPLRQGQGVLRVALAPQTQCLDAEQQLLRREGIQRAA